MDSNFAEVKELLRTGKYTKLVYSASDESPDDLGTGLFDVALEVR